MSFNFPFGPQPTDPTNPLMSLAAPQTTDWTAALTKIGTPSFMQPGFTPASPVMPASPFDWKRSLFGDGTRENPGNFGSILGAAGGLTSAFLGLKQYGLAKQALDKSQKQFEMNYAAQRDLTNNRLEDRQAARVASNPNGYQDVASYMSRWGVK